MQLYNSYKWLSKCKHNLFPAVNSTCSFRRILNPRVQTTIFMLPIRQILAQCSLIMHLPLSPLTSNNSRIESDNS